MRMRLVSGGDSADAAGWAADEGGIGAAAGGAAGGFEAGDQAGWISVSDYVDAEGMSGYFQIEHKVYGRGGEPCAVCGAPIKKIVVGGRGTHYCARCQK